MTNATFTNGQTYFYMFIGDSDLRPKINIVKRTSKTVTFEQRGKIETAKIHTDEDGEYFYPSGRYSMAPICRAKNRN
jgi:outer membrane protein assembly factor BamE (lipoprotein component of BamABCDE complex)